MSGQIFKDTTLYFSCSMSTLATVVPVMDHINETLASQSLDSNFEPAICAALGLAKKVLNHYYSSMDHSEVHLSYCNEYVMFCTNLPCYILTSNSVTPSFASIT